MNKGFFPIKYKEPSELNIEVLRFNTININNRIYRHESFINLDEVHKKINDKTLLGQIDHPNELEIHLNKASHIVTDLSINENKLMAKIKIIDTNSGQMLKTLVETKRVVFRTAGSGAIINNEVTDYCLHSINAIPIEQDSWGGIIIDY
jgi:hypothetical protein